MCQRYSTIVYRHYSCNFFDCAFCRSSLMRFINWLPPVGPDRTVPVPWVSLTTALDVLFSRRPRLKSFLASILGSIVLLNFYPVASVGLLLSLVMLSHLLIIHKRMLFFCLRYSVNLPRLVTFRLTMSIFTALSSLPDGYADRIKWICGRYRDHWWFWPWKWSAWWCLLVRTISRCSCTTASVQVRPCLAQ